jgi:ketosteroid isomerase-like protein
MKSEDVVERIAALEERIRLLEDQAILYRLIASWGPAADTANGAAASSFWAEDAVLVAEANQINGAAAVGAMIDSEGQLELVRQGCAHVQGLPTIHIDGDLATAVNYGRVYLHTPDGYDVWRVSANCWNFRRTEQGWRVSRREVHVIDGGPEARELLHRAIAAREVTS